MTPDEIFESAITWLLSLLGYSVIHLRKQYEELRDPLNKYLFGSIDILAFKSDEHLLLVDCDTSVPDDKKFSSILGIKAKLAPKLKSFQDKYGIPRIVPVVFSPRDCAGLSRSNVVIIDKSGIEDLLEKAMTRDIEAISYHFSAYGLGGL